MSYRTLETKSLSKVHLSTQPTQLHKRKQLPTYSGVKTSGETLFKNVLMQLCSLQQVAYRIDLLPLRIHHWSLDFEPFKLIVCSYSVFFIPGKAQSLGWSVAIHAESTREVYDRYIVPGPGRYGVRQKLKYA